MTVYPLDLVRRRMLPLLPVAMTIGLIAVLMLHPRDMWLNALHIGWYLTGIGLAGPLLVAMNDLAGAKWHRPIIPIARQLEPLISIGSAFILAALLFGNVIPPVEGHGFRALWLARDFVLLRAFVYVALWLVLRRKRALFIVVFGLTVWLASVDWIMSLDTHWSSTIFGVYHFAGLFSAGIALMILLGIHSERATLHDLGKMLFAFSTFWMYIWFSQYMLIWYGNMPEETGYFSDRLRGNWSVLFAVNVILNWVVPFIVLLPQWTKMNRVVLFRVAVVVLIGHWLDVYISIFGSRLYEPSLGPVEVLTALVAVIAMMAIRGDHDVRRAVPHQSG